MADGRPVWVNTEQSVFGVGYVTVIAYDDDNVLQLDHDRMLSYAETMISALTRAQYTEGVRRQLRALSNRNGGRITERHVVETVLEFRDDWPELPEFAPYRIVPIVSVDGRPSVQVQKGDGEVVVQFAPHNVAEHVVHVLQVYAVADLDSSYRRYLVGTIGTDEGRAAAAINDLGKYLPAKDEINGLDGLPPRTGRRRPGRRRR